MNSQQDLKNQKHRFNLFSHSSSVMSSSGMFAVLGLATLVGLSGCAPSATQIKKVIEDNPEILFNVIEKHPSEFLQVVNKAAMQARAIEDQKAQEEETKLREEEFKNPKKPELADSRAYEGDMNAPVTIVEYSDFQCPYCRRGHETMMRVLKEYPGKVRVLFKNLPITTIHPKAKIASQYYEAIALQDKAKAARFKDEVFQEQPKLTDKGEDYLKAVAKKVGANMAKLSKDIDSKEVMERLEADKSEAEKFEFNGTPGYLVNGVALRGAYPFDQFKGIIDRHLANLKK